jgi:hypothetical protein
MEEATHNLIGMPPHRTSLAAAIFSAPILLAGQVSAHEARRPQSSSPWAGAIHSCCSGIDCRQVSERAISERPDGYVINGTGELVAYRDSRVKNAPDGVYHCLSLVLGSRSQRRQDDLPLRSAEGILGFA